MVKVIKRVTTALSYVVNYIFHPVLMPLYLFTILLFYSSMMMQNEIAIKFSILRMVAFITVLTPFISIGASIFITKIMGERNTNGYNNILVSTILTVSYGLAIYVLKDYITLQLSFRLLLAPFFIIMQYHLLRMIKIRLSLWTATVASLTTFMYLLSFHYIGGLVPILFSSIMICGLVGSARLYLRKDSFKTVLLGYAMGIFATIMSFYLPTL